MIMHFYDNTVIRSGNDCQIRNLFVALKNQIAVELVLVFKSMTRQGELMGYFNGPLNKHPW